VDNLDDVFDPPRDRAHTRTPQGHSYDAEGFCERAGCKHEGWRTFVGDALWCLACLEEFNRAGRGVHLGAIAPDDAPILSLKQLGDRQRALRQRRDESRAALGPWPTDDQGRLLDVQRLDAATIAQAAGIVVPRGSDGLVASVTWVCAGEAIVVRNAILGTDERLVAFTRCGSALVGFECVTCRVTTISHVELDEHVASRPAAEHRVVTICLRHGVFEGLAAA
jgi:hypothetical protein